MPFAKRIIPCLDVHAGRVVKGVKFQELRDAGDPIEVAARYDQEGADEVTFLDISASHEERKTTLDMVEQTARQVFIPLTVGGGIRNVDNMRDTLNAGADKTAMNTAAIYNPEIVSQGAARFGSQCIVVAIDAKKTGPVEEAVSAAEISDEVRNACAMDETSQWQVFTHGGRQPTGLDAVKWARFVVSRGAGEILLTSMDRDGTKIGYDNDLNSAISSTVPVPVIASGGAGEAQHLVDAVIQGKADAVLAASIFHFREVEISTVKSLMQQAGISVRLAG